MLIDGKHLAAGHTETAPEDPDRGEVRPAESADGLSSRDRAGGKGEDLGPSVPPAHSCVEVTMSSFRISQTSGFKNVQGNKMI